MWGYVGTYPLSDGSYNTTGCALLGTDPSNAASTSSPSFFPQPVRTTNLISNAASMAVGVGEDYWNEPRQLSIAVRVKGANGADLRQRIYDLTSAFLVPGQNLFLGVNLCRAPCPGPNMVNGQRNWGWQNGWSVSGRQFLGTFVSTPGYVYLTYDLPVQAGFTYWAACSSQVTSYTAGTGFAGFGIDDVNGSQLSFQWIRSMTSFDSAATLSSTSYKTPPGATQAVLTAGVSNGSTMQLKVWDFFFGLGSLYTVLQCPGPTTSFTQTTTTKYRSDVVFQPWVKPFASDGRMGPY